MMWTTTLLLFSSFIADPGSTGVQDRSDERVEIDCSTKLAQRSDLIMRKCREASAAQGSNAVGSTKILIPVAAAAAAGIGLATLKQDEPTSREQ